jgi:hypothetical protein
MTDLTKEQLEYNISQAKDWINKVIVGSVMSLSWLTGAKRITITYKVFEDGTTNTNFDISYAKQRKPKNE